MHFSTPYLGSETSENTSKNDKRTKVVVVEDCNEALEFCVVGTPGPNPGVRPPVPYKGIVPGGGGALKDGFVIGLLVPPGVPLGVTIPPAALQISQSKTKYVIDRL